jgi:hypothetical protein
MQETYKTHTTTSFPWGISLFSNHFPLFIYLHFKLHTNAA